MTFKFISIVIPVYNDPKGVQVTLMSLINQKYPKNKYELLVIDNGSKDETYKVCQKFLNDFPDIVHLFKELSIRSSYAARNKGIQNAKGDLIVFIDADMTVKKDCLYKINTAITNDIHYLCGNVIIYTKQAPGIAEKHNQETGFPIKEYIYKHHFAPTCCLIVSRKLLNEVGTFDANLISGGDREFGNRVFKQGIELHYSANIIFYHPARKTIKALVKKSFRVALGMKQLGKYYPDRYPYFKNRKINFSELLPPKPLKVKKEFLSIWKTLKINEKIGFYIIFYFQRITRNSAYLYADLTNKLQS